ncbi:MAG TPA: hypothetical protein VNA24_05515, partial [Hyalangium sp.]|nr:hypothetical protein [Hyalangium sp.]
QAVELAEVRENTLFTIPRLLARISKAGAKPDALAVDYSDIAGRYRILAICALLLDADGERFRGFLQKAAQTRLQLLKLGLKPEREVLEIVCESMNLELFDAVAGGDLPTAAALAKSSPGRHIPDIEYEDDFLLYRFFGLLALQLHEGKQAPLEELAERWQAVLEGGEDPYLDVSRALLARDSKKLGTAITRLIESRDERIEQWWEDLSMDPATRLANSLVFVNGLALLRFAELLGLKTRSDYKFMPSMARVPSKPRILAEGSWREPLSNLNN